MAHKRGCSYGRRKSNGRCPSKSSGINRALRKSGSKGCAGRTRKGHIKRGYRLKKGHGCPVKA